MRRKLWWAMGAVLSVAAGVAACGSSGNGNGTTGKNCVPGATNNCTCVNSANQTINGTQVCTADGQGYGACSCFSLGTGGSACSCSVPPSSEQYCGASVCGNTSSSSGTSSGGTGGSTSTSTSTSTGTSTSTTSSSSSAAASSSSGAPCTSKPIFAGKVSATTGFASNWSYKTMSGLAAGTQACVDQGADHVCDYDDIVNAIKYNDANLKTLTTTDVAWLNRTHSVTITATSPKIVVLGQPATMGTTYQVSKGSRCADWNYSTDHLNDGEIIDFSTGVMTPTFHFDDNPCAIQAAPKDIPCGHNGTQHDVLCCYPKDTVCNPPVANTTCTCNGTTCQ